MPSPLVLAAILFAVLALALFVAGFYAIKQRRLLGTAASLTLAILLLSLAGLCATISVATQGYRAFTREEVAAVVETRPTGAQSFNATFRFPDGREKSFSLAGDEFYVDAHILKWKPIANFLGLHTAYELDRVSGRYVRLQDEQLRPRTVFALADDKLVDMFQLRRRFPLLKPLVDAEYGSATFMLASERARFEVRVSTTGLLIRRVLEDSL
ncbi:MAG: hypothetical protein GTN78_18825 [Gemmatimonadales bacterium]|nr:hypothetical protein [Gemmatimonadales bacterium]NIN12931.1 hypothetical protein [Gemmatimonadales bacterium]NIR02219.1 hypothetical protein [Gemmatimonadales bacterium]NIS66011.1 hypothetical protein [Gemmatimonadales bacterium]